MHRLIYILPLSLLLACQAKTDYSIENIELTAPVETQAPNSPEKKAAFEGQTRIQGIKTRMPYESKILFEGLKQPWGLTSLPDGRLILTEKEGCLRIFDLKTNIISAPITGLPPVVNEAQGGLLDIALSPSFQENQTLFVSFSEQQAEGTLTAIARIKLSEDLKKVIQSNVIFRAVPAFDSRLHYGSRIVIDQQGNLFVSTGERSDIKSRPQAQHLNSALGKIIHITPEGKALTDNPFVSDAQKMPEIYSYGHRNVQSLALDNAGNLWEAEFGPRGGDELNLISKGKNYGWPTITYGIEYSGKTIGNGLTQLQGMEKPSEMALLSYKEWNNPFIIGILQYRLVE